MFNLNESLGSFGRRIGQLATNPRGLILMYHRVRTPTNYGPDAGAVAPASFRSQLSRINDQLPVRTIADLKDFYGRNSSPDELFAVLTFDDGYHDFRETVLPVLETYDLPATLFVNSGLIETDGDPIEYELYDAVEAGRIPGGTIHNQKNSLDSNRLSQDEKRKLYRRLKHRLKFSSPKQRREYRRAIPEPSSSDSSPSRLMDWDDLLEVKDHSLITLAGHGGRHLPLTLLSQERVREYFVREKRIFNRKLGLDVDAIAYPYGDVNNTVRDTAHELGYSLGFTTEPRLVYGSNWEDRLTLPRLDACGLDLVSNLRKVTGP